MLKRELLIPSILTIIYVLLCVLAFIFMMSQPATDKFAAIFIAALTQPWSFLIALFINLLEIIFNFEFKYIENNIILLICVVVNTALVFFIANKIMIKKRKGGAS